MTLEKLAALAHVSVSTASRALNDGYGISPATRAQVLHVAEQCGYFESKKKVKLENRRQEHFHIAIICPEIISVYYANMAQALLAEFRRYGCRCTIYSSDFAPEELTAQVEKCRKDYAVDAIICLAQLPALPPAGIPVAAFDSDGAPICFHNQMADGIRQALADLQQSGCRRVLFAGERLTPEKEAAFRRRSAELGFAHAAVFCSAARFEQAGVEAAQALLAMPERPQGVLCAYDEIAFGLIDTVQRAGVAVPDELRVIGINDVPAARYVFGGLTTVRDMFETICPRVVADIIRDRRDGVVRRHEYAVPAQLIRRFT